MLARAPAPGDAATPRGYTPDAVDGEGAVGTPALGVDRDDVDADSDRAMLAAATAALGVALATREAAAVDAAAEAGGIGGVLRAAMAAVKGGTRWGPQREQCCTHEGALRAGRTEGP